MALQSWRKILIFKLFDYLNLGQKPDRIICFISTKVSDFFSVTYSEAYYLNNNIAALFFLQ